VSIMRTRRATRARVQTQQNSPPPTQHNTSANDEGDVSTRVLHNLTKEVSDIKAQMAAMEANLHFIFEQLRNPPHTHRASPRSSHPHQDITMILVARRRTYNAPFQGNLLTLGDKGMFLLTPKKQESTCLPFMEKTMLRHI